jgi:hypothetical protein
MPRAQPRPRPLPTWRSVTAGLLAGGLLVAGCGKKAPSTEAPADSAAADAPAAESMEPGVDDHGPGHILDDGLSRYAIELEGYEDALLSAGLELPGAVAQARADEGKASVPAADGGGDAEGARCERICELATNICGLRDHICELADEHRNELRYAQICERAELDCQRATAACEGCDG